MAIDTPPTAPPRGTPRSAITLLMVPLMLVLFIADLDQTVVAAALPGIGRELHQQSGVSWVVTGYLLTSSVTTLIYGKLGDMYGRKPVFQFSIVVFLAGSLLCGTAGSLPLLVGYRALQGIGGGGLNSLVMAITADLVPARRRGTYQAVTGLVATLALIAGPLLGGALTDSLSWRWIFLINLPIGIAALLTVGALLHLPRGGRGGRPDISGGLAVTVLTTAVLLVTTWGGERYRWTSPIILGLIALSVLAFAGYLLIERRAAEPITPLRLFRSSVFSLAAGQFLLATLVLFAAMLYMPMFAETVRGDSPFTAGLFDIPLLVGLVAAAMLSGPLITRTGRYKVYPVLGAVLTGGAMLLLSRAGADTGTAALVLPLLVAGAGIGFFVQVSLLAGQNAVEYRHLGVATGALNFFKSLGGAFGAALFGAILAARLPAAAPTAADRAPAFQAVFGWTVPFMALALLLALLMREEPLSEEIRRVADGTVEAPEY